MPLITLHKDATGRNPLFGVRRIVCAFEVRRYAGAFLFFELPRIEACGFFGDDLRL